MSERSDRYRLACDRTEVEARFGLTREAAALAHQIRWSPDKREEYNYPNSMDLATTCCCHIVVDDGNISDSDVAFCIQYAAEHEHQDCLRLALLLARASLTQRRKIRRLAWA